MLKELKKKGTDAGVDAAKSGGKAAVSSAVDIAKDESRKISVKVTNKSNLKWTKPKFFLDCGVTDSRLPPEVENGSEVKYDVHKKKWTLSGIAGVIAYDWEAEGKEYTLAVMFRSPMMSANDWNAEIYSETTVDANQQLFSTLTREGAIKGDCNYSTKEFGPFVLQGAMTFSDTAKLNVIISCMQNGN